MSFTLFNRTQIQRWASAHPVYARGREYARLGRVRDLTVRREGTTLFVSAYAVGRGGSLYQVEFVWEGEEGWWRQAACSCPFSAGGSRVCKHLVAVALTVLEHGKVLRLSASEAPQAPEAPSPTWVLHLDLLVERLRQARRPRERSPAPYDLAFTLGHVYLEWGSVPIPLPLVYFLREDGEEGDPGRRAWERLRTQGDRWQHPTALLDPSGCRNLPPEVVHIANLSLQWSRLREWEAQRFVRTSLLEEAWGLLHRAAERSPIPFLLYPPGRRRPVAVEMWPAHKPLTVGLLLDRGAEGVRLEPALWSEEATYPSSSWILLEDRPILLLLEERWLVPLVDRRRQRLWAALQQEPRVLTVPPAEEEAFQARLAGLLREGVPIRTTAGVSLSVETLEEGVPEPRLYLREDRDGGLIAELRFGYGPLEVPYDRKAPAVELRWVSAPYRYLRIRRDLEAETSWKKRAASREFGLKLGPGATLLLRARVHPVEFLLDRVPALARAGFTVFGAEALLRRRMKAARPVLRLEVSSGIDWWDLKARLWFGEQAVPLREALEVLRRGERFVKLADGSVGLLPEDLVERLRRRLDLARWIGEDRIRLEGRQAPVLEELLDGLQELPQVELRVPEEEVRALRERLRALREVEGLPEVPLPEGLRGQLRPYQVLGYRWLHLLYRHGLGGILADEMGLGKTLQTLAFLLSLREQGLAQGPDLVVVPRSLLFNWAREAETFAPGLRVLVYAGARRPDPAAFDRYDLVLTTYGIVRREAQALAGRSFHVLVLDEAQAIKNPLTKAARSVRRLQARFRLALTGTPVENTTLELWSIFAAVLPGLLGSLEAFKRSFALPIEQHGDREAARRLRRLVAPFLLRRTKDQVTPELPPRTEQVMYAEMTAPQREVYRKVREVYRAKLLGLLDGRTEEAQLRMHVLEGLLRLRQLANHPALVDPDYRGGSGKVALLFTLLETVVEEGHKALVYSQFVEMLRLLGEEMERRGWAYAYLDGRTRDRQAQVERFQTDPRVPLFLISLRAGGTGLNLTAARYVFLLDPWWNPAVERQAADRIHRIGQDKPVFVYKLIASDTVEEKILDLQTRKRDLVERLVTPTEAAWLRHLGREEIERLFG